MKIVEIRKASDKVRYNLCIEDLCIGDIKGLIEFGILSVDLVQTFENTIERVYTFKDPVNVPEFRKFYAFKISSVYDKNLEEVFRRLLYLNPNPDLWVQKKIVEGSLQFFVAKKEAESKVLTEASSSVPVLTYEEVYPVLQKVLKEPSGYIPLTDKKVFFQKDSKLRKEEKRVISFREQRNFIKQTTETLIHQVAQLVNEEELYLEINTKRISTVASNLSLHKINKYMSDRTKEYVEEANVTKFFKTQKSQDKFIEYLTLRESGVDKKNACRQIGVSDSTKIEFAKIEQQIKE